MTTADQACIRQALTLGLDVIERGNDRMRRALAARGLDTAAAQREVARWWTDDAPIDMRSLIVQIGSHVSAGEIEGRSLRTSATSRRPKRLKCVLWKAVNAEGGRS
jgi:hypothetical protein